MNTILLKHNNVLDLLQALVDAHSSTSIDLIICSSRTEFIAQIIAGLQKEPAVSQVEDDGHGGGSETESPIKPTHPVLKPTLNRLYTSQNVKLIFCPTVSALRAYLSGYLVQLPRPDPTSQRRTVIVNSLALHHGSSEFTVQGLSQTMATMVAAGARARRQVQLVECMDSQDSNTADHGPQLWNNEVPLLSSSLKIGEGGARWGLRTIPVARIASRWFEFKDVDL
ncbi:hypothetical protein B0A52_05407 [Exophiala mesophila]|uniref:Uncharacterized protein n=1 Tax=Exophiala mesophila TaxID=212818 RepID=A0A438N4U2_EXOME|nr:hypothetical protein B0A52_05407 [Exophiala mesophila]